MHPPAGGTRRVARVVLFPHSGMPDLDRFFSPTRVAVIGATQDAAKIGGRIVRTLIEHGFRGIIYPVNPSHAEIAGLKSYESVRALPEPVDLALIAVPAPKVPDVLQSCALAGIKGAVIYSSGFSEAGEAGMALYQRLKEISKRTGIRVAGPNTEGFYNIAGNTAATFNAAIDIDKGDLDASSHIAIVSQSGGLGFAFFNKGRRDDLVFSHIVSVGNQVDLEIADYVAWLIEQERVRVILMYVESLVDPPRFLDAARRAAELGKPIVMIKIGNSDAGRRAAGSHTGAMVGPASAVNAALAHHGIIRAEDQDELLNIAAAFIHNPLPAGNRVGIVSVSGGTAAWLADACTAAGLEVPQLDAERRTRIAGCIPSFGASDNPVDVTAQVSDGFVKCLETVGEAPCIDGLIMAVNFATERRLVKEGRAIADWIRRVGKPVLIYSYAIPSDRSRELLRELDCTASPRFRDACGASVRWSITRASSVRAEKSLRRFRHRATCRELQDTCSIRPRRSSANTRPRLCSRRTACACHARSSPEVLKKPSLMHESSAIPWRSRFSPRKSPTRPKRGASSSHCAMKKAFTRRSMKSSRMPGRIAVRRRFAAFSFRRWRRRDES